MEGGRAKEKGKEEVKGEESHRKGGGEPSLHGFIRDRRSVWEEDKGTLKPSAAASTGTSAKALKGVSVQAPKKVVFPRSPRSSAVTWTLN